MESHIIYLLEIRALQSLILMKIIDVIKDWRALRVYIPESILSYPFLQNYKINRDLIEINWWIAKDDV